MNSGAVAELLEILAGDDLRGAERMFRDLGDETQPECFGSKHAAAG